MTTLEIKDVDTVLTPCHTTFGVKLFADAL